MKEVSADAIVLEIYQGQADRVREVELGVRQTSRYLALFTPYEREVKVVLKPRDADRLLARRVVESEMDGEPVLMALKAFVNWHSKYTAEVIWTEEKWREQP